MIKFEDLDQRIIERTAIFAETFKQLHKVAGWGKGVQLNVDVLYITMISYFHDIDRYKSFHGSEWADEHKSAGYTIKWISKFKPIMLVPGYDCSAEDKFCNQIYAVICGLSFLNVELDNISNDFLSTIYYHLYFRNSSGMELSSKMYVIEKAMNEQTP